MLHFYKLSLTLSVSAEVSCDLQYKIPPKAVILQMQERSVSVNFIHKIYKKINKLNKHWSVILKWNK